MIPQSLRHLPAILASVVIVFSILVSLFLYRKRSQYTIPFFVLLVFFLFRVVVDWEKQQLCLETIGSVLFCIVFFYYVEGYSSIDSTN